MLELTHHNDGKCKSQSHTVGIVDKTEYGLEAFDLSGIRGHGKTSEEALEDFKQKFDAEMKRLKSFETMLFETDALIPIEVDYAGNEMA